MGQTCVGMRRISVLQTPFDNSLCFALDVYAHMLSSPPKCHSPLPSKKSRVVLCVRRGRGAGWQTSQGTLPDINRDFFTTQLSRMIFLNRYLGGFLNTYINWFFKTQISIGFLKHKCRQGFITSQGFLHKQTSITNK
jgi:hypothetical protein